MQLSFLLLAIKGTHMKLHHTKLIILITGFLPIHVCSTIGTQPLAQTSSLQGIPSHITTAQNYVARDPLLQFYIAYGAAKAAYHFCPPIRRITHTFDKKTGKYLSRLWDIPTSIAQFGICSRLAQHAISRSNLSSHLNNPTLYVTAQLTLATKLWEKWNNSSRFTREIEPQSVNQAEGQSEDQDEVAKQLNHILKKESKLKTASFKGINEEKRNQLQTISPELTPFIKDLEHPDRSTALFLHGDTGTGKSFFVESLPEALGKTVWKLEAKVLASSAYKGSEERFIQILKQYFEHLINTKKLRKGDIVFFEELDGLLRASNQQEKGLTQVKTKGIMGVQEKLNELGLIYVVTANNISNIETTVTDRFNRFGGHKVQKELPNRVGRNKILINQINQLQLEESCEVVQNEKLVNYITEHTDHTTPTNLKKIITNIFREHTNSCLSTVDFENPESLFIINKALHDTLVTRTQSIKNDSNTPTSYGYLPSDQAKKFISKIEEKQKKLADKVIPYLIANIKNNDDLDVEEKKNKLVEIKATYDPTHTNQNNIIDLNTKIKNLRTSIDELNKDIQKKESSLTSNSNNKIALKEEIRIKTQDKIKHEKELKTLNNKLQNTQNRSNQIKQHLQSQSLKNLYNLCDTPPREMGNLADKTISDRQKIRQSYYQWCQTNPRISGASILEKFRENKITNNSLIKNVIMQEHKPFYFHELQATHQRIEKLKKKKNSQSYIGKIASMIASSLYLYPSFSQQIEKLNTTARNLEMIQKIPAEVSSDRIKFPGKLSQIKPEDCTIPHHDLPRLLGKEFYHNKKISASLQYKS